MATGKRVKEEMVENKRLKELKMNAILVLIATYSILFIAGGFSILPRTNSGIKALYSDRLVFQA